MTLFRSDTWADDQPEVQAGLARKRADTSAWHAFNAMERAIGGVRQALADPDLGSEWADQLRAVCLRAGAMAAEQEAC